MITLAALFVLCVGLIASVVLATNVSEQNKLDKYNETVRQLDSITSQINVKLNGYKQLLISGAALMQLNPETSRDEWRNFVSNLQLGSQFPSILGMGYVEYFPANQTSQYEEKIRASGLENFSVTPSTIDKPRQYVTAITYLEPQNEVNLKTIGFDMFSEEARHAAMQSAIDNASMAVSAPVELVQFENNPNGPRGILIYFPIYSTATVPATVSERRQKIIGFTYLVNLPRTFVSVISNSSAAAKEDIHLTDISGQPPVSLNTFVSHKEDEKHITQIIRASNRVWRVSISQLSSTSLQRWLPMGIFVAGTTLSLLTSVLIFRALAHKLSSIARQFDQKIQETKEDMLALASHQLRTPASGVKQYIGMLTQGFVGELSEQQRQIADKAYAANERQLEIINQMLYVAKADAGQLMLEPERIDLLEMAKSSISLQRTTAGNKNITLKLDSTIPTQAYGDPRYISMIIDNLINNAIKYTQPGNEVSMYVFVAEKRACLSVSDEGVGIRKQDISKVFEKFARLENPLSKSEGGNGLGLYLAHGLAKAHGGDLEVRSEVNVGSTFTLSLPRSKSTKNKIRVRLDQIETERS